MSSADEPEIVDDTKELWKVYGQVTRDPSISRVFNELPQPISRRSGLHELITEIEKITRFPLTDLAHYFTFNSNKNDPRDNLDDESLTLEAFTRRLGNYLLEQIYIRGQYEKSLKEFIMDVRGDFYEVADEMRENLQNYENDEQEYKKEEEDLENNNEDREEIRENREEIEVNKEDIEENGEEVYENKEEIGENREEIEGNAEEFEWNAEEFERNMEDKESDALNKAHFDENSETEQADGEKEENKENFLFEDIEFKGEIYDNGVIEDKETKEDKRFNEEKESAEKNEDEKESLSKDKSLENSKIKTFIERQEKNESFASKKSEKNESKISKLSEKSSNSFIKRSPTQTDKNSSINKKSPAHSPLHRSTTSIESKPAPSKQLSKQFSHIKEEIEIEKSYKQAESPKSPSRNLDESKNSRKKQEVQIFNRSFKKNQSSSEKEEEEEEKSGFLGLGLSKLAINEVRQERRKSESSSGSELLNKEESKVEETIQNSFITVLSPESHKKQWFTDSIRGREDHFKSIFTGFNKKKSYVTVKELPAIFSAIIEELQIVVHDHHHDMFKNLFETLHPVKIIKKPKQKPKSEYTKLYFTNFTELMNLWGEKYMKEQEKVAGALAKTIKEYQILAASYKEIPKLNEIVSNLASFLDMRLSEHVEGHKDNVNLKENYKKNLEDLFLFYTKVQKNPGTEDTFESIEASNTTLSLGKFLKFCIDFNLLLGKTEEKRGLSKDQLTSIFKRTANNTRLMSEAQFIDALDKIAEIFYSPELDKALKTRFAYLPLPDKREMLYKLLGLHNFNIYHHKKKAFGTGFSPEKYSRVPLSDSSHQYKFKISEDSQQKLELWKKNKTTSKSPPLLKPINEVVRQDSMKNSRSFVRRSGKALPASGYALRLKARKSQIDAKSEEKVVQSEENRFGRLEPQNEPQEVPNRVITIQALNNLSYKDIDDEYGINDLISGETDEFFDKLYGIEPKLQGIMKMHDDKLARGQKVIERNKYSYKNINP